MRRIVLASLTLVGACVQTPAATHDQLIHDLATDSNVSGDRPDRAQGIAQVEAAIRGTLKDPDSAKFEWPNDFVAGWYKPPFGKRYEGWITCGTINAKNSYGGYVGRAAAIGVISNGVVIKIDMDDATARFGTFVEQACGKIGVPVP